METGGGRNREGEERVREFELENSFYKDCSLGSVKSLPNN